jgi:hypothetical protein
MPHVIAPQPDRHTARDSEIDGSRGRCSGTNQGRSGSACSHTSQEAALARAAATTRAKRRRFELLTGGIREVAPDPRDPDARRTNMQALAALARLNCAAPPWSRRQAPMSIAQLLRIYEARRQARRSAGTRGQLPRARRAPGGVAGRGSRAIPTHAGPRLASFRPTTPQSACPGTIPGVEPPSSRRGRCRASRRTSRCPARGAKSGGVGRSATSDPARLPEPWLNAYVCQSPDSARRPACTSRSRRATRVQACPTSCPTAPKSPMVKPKSGGTIIRVPAFPSSTGVLRGPRSADPRSPRDLSYGGDW